MHSTIHPIMGPDKGNGMPPLIFYRQSTASDLGAMAKRVGAKHLCSRIWARPSAQSAKAPLRFRAAL